MKSGRIFQDEALPEDTALVGYAHLVSKYGIQTCVRFPACVSKSHVRGTVARKGIWQLYDKRFWPGDDDIEHLVFALKHEYFDLLSLKRILDVLPLEMMENYIRSSPSGIYARKIWFLYEWFNEVELKIVDCPKCQSIPILEPEKYFTGQGAYSKRHRIHNNLPGSKMFSPIIRRTPVLEEFVRSGLRERAEAVIGKVSRSLIARAASFMLLADSRASFAIEGERVSVNRIERWGKAVLQAGKFPITKEEIVRLQKIIIEDSRFTHIGLRKEGVFLGERDADHNPLPEFIGANPEDLETLVAALVAADGTMAADGLDPVLHAAAIAFGFVYIHPLEDGNGRLHRYLIHHVLAERKFSPPGLVFPISSSMLKSIDRYREVLRNHSLPLMDFIKWETTEKMNVKVLNDTRDLYSSFDCTEACEFLYSCIRETIEKDLPEELHYLKCHDQAMTGINRIVDIPDNMAKSLVLFVWQNNGVLPKKRRRKEFAALTDTEVAKIERAVKEAFSTSEVTQVVSAADI
jgi:hypothetical protein